MTAPNIASLTTVTGKVSVQVISTSPSAIVSNSNSSNTVVKINNLTVSNVGSVSANLTVDLYRSSTAYRLAYNLNVPVGTSITLLDKHLYVEEGDSIRLTSDTASTLEGICSYEIIG